MSLATCPTCGVIAEGDADEVDAAAERHTKKQGHATTTRLRGTP